MDYEDVLSDGTIGLIEAVERFDPSTGVKFGAYAINRIRGSIIDQLRKADRLPRSARQNMRKVEQANEVLRETLDTEVAEQMEVAIGRYHTILADASWVTVSLENLLDASAEGEGYPTAEIPKDPEAQDANRKLDCKETVGTLASVIMALPERERLAVSLYYQDELT